MIDIILIKDGGATKFPRQVADEAAVQALIEQGFEVQVVGGSGEGPAEAAETAGGAEPTEAVPAKPKRTKAA